MWILGGIDGFDPSVGLLNDIWYSTDGETWTEATASAEWAPRYGHTAIAYEDRMWIMGGYASAEYQNDVWSSDDGISWTLETNNAGWPPRHRHASVNFNDKIWILGGSSTNAKYNDVWNSEPDNSGGGIMCSATASAKPAGYSGLDDVFLLLVTSVLLLVPSITRRSEGTLRPDVQIGLCYEEKSVRDAVTKSIKQSGFNVPI
jgi:hypothetical protein